eukprot:CAMPEP_0175557388 /NCGR_PEP_ID=MMETSP0096-20121207/35348_1 /TAXON_ID=311494 /ORGANISM="Alexandrium monilatum, Strain CCMP3105" /LENGTH=336 /DNA_ID=CAMNT_0016860533 /DNA_START=76 /DNA_END=1085 /DNA_ORIENTATION=+
MATGGSPPGLWQPPGLGGLAAGPPTQPPPPATAPPPPSAAALAAGAFSIGAVGEGREDLQKEISSTIEAQVSRLIEQARHDTESKVKMELKQIRDVMMTLDGRLDQLIGQLDGMEPRESPEPHLDAETVGHLLSKIEQQWGQEIRTLKQELHQTILAHNHNADLIKHHKDTIDALRERCVRLQGNSVKTTEIQAQLARLDARLKQQQKQRKLEPLLDRLTVLEQKVAAAAHWRFQNMGVGATGDAGAAGSGAAAAAAAATGVGLAPPAVPKSGEKAAFKCPTDEEVQAHLSKLSVGAEAGPRAEEAQAAAEGAAAPAAAPTPQSAPVPAGETEEAS